jgi:tRNA(fMet)-specific endonuclease VapC
VAARKRREAVRLNYLLDTNVVSVALRGRPEIVRRRFDDVILRGETVALSMLVYHELYFGALRSASPDKNLTRLQLFKERFGNPIEFTESDAQVAAEIRMVLSTNGNIIGPYDTLIAAQALRLDATLVTSNVREFSRVPGLKWEDWTSA